MHAHARPSGHFENKNSVRAVRTVRIGRMVVVAQIWPCSVRPRAIAVLCGVVRGGTHDHNITVLIEQSYGAIVPVKDQGRQAKRIDKQHWIVLDVSVKIEFPAEFQRIFAQEPPDRRIIVPAPVVAQSSLRIEVSACVLERICETARSSCELAE